MWTATHRERYKDDGRRYPSDLTDTEWETIKRIKGLCGAQPPHKPCWTNAVVLVEWSGTVEPARVSGLAGQPGTYIRWNFHAARLAPESIAGAEGPSENRR